MRISAAQRTENENRILAVIDRLPPGGRCDVKTLAAEASVDRTAFYGNRPYARLRVEFEQRLRAMQQGGEIPDPRDAQILRLKADNRALSERLAKASGTIDELTDFRAQAVARQAAQHEEISRLRRLAADDSGTSIARPRRNAVTVLLKRRREPNHKYDTQIQHNPTESSRQ
jgi:hypothetical protein